MDVKNSIGNGVAKELKCMIRGHKLRWEVLLERMRVADGGGQSGKTGTTVIA